MVKLWQSQCSLRQEIDELTAPLYQPEISRRFVADQPDNVAVELLRAWLGKNYQRATFRRLLEFTREADTGKLFNLPRDEMILAKRAELVVIGDQKLLK